ncbi:hypothetical protein TELCIR_13326 [Teladorsagia circumcincta]|uniref:RRM domain-containing protein n=1 Tax=Teladorsagia circumcincta TaxID=45464 RepID=A0A2G9U4B1_TELCI|nr:hypothetical protein TELCIR_13326 [Teladorsagia circumcincta]
MFKLYPSMRGDGFIEKSSLRLVFLQFASLSSADVEFGQPIMLEDEAENELLYALGVKLGTDPDVSEFRSLLTCKGARLTTSGRDGDRRSGAGSMGERMVFITNLAYEVRWVELKDILREHGGEVVFVELLEDRNGHPKGNAIAEFKTKEAAAKCIKNLDGFEIRKRKIITKPIRDPVAFLRKVQEETGVDYLAKCGGAALARGRDDRPTRTGSYDLFGLSPEFLRQHNIEPPLCDRVFIANAIGAGLGANGAPLTDVASVVASLRGETIVPTAPIAPVPAQAGQFSSFGMGSGVISGNAAFQSTPYSVTPHIANDDSFIGADSRRDDSQFGMNYNVSRVVVIRNLPPDYTWQIVRDRVQQFGDAESVDMIAPGVARIRFALIQDAERMRGALTGTSVEGRTISVEYMH